MNSPLDDSFVTDNNIDANDDLVTSSKIKFCIGFIAGIAAVGMPRLVTMLTSGTDRELEYFTANFTYATLILGVMLGLIIAIFEHGKPKQPKETFFAALAIPGLVIGSLNSANNNAVDNDLFASRMAQLKEISQQNDVKFETKSAQDSSLMLLSDLLIDSPVSMLFNPISPRIEFSFISITHAAEPLKLEKPNKGYGLSIQREKPKYVVSLFEFDNTEQAIQAIQQIKTTNPTVIPKTAIMLKSTDGSLNLLNSNQLLTESEATLLALKLKRQISTVKIIEVKK